MNKSALDNKYYIESDTLFRERIAFDGRGVAIARSKNGLFYNPAYIAWHGLCVLNRYYKGKDESYLRIMEKQITWLKENARWDRVRKNIWTYEVDHTEGKNILKKPWISAMAQGLIISFLVRAYTLTKEDDLMKLAEGASGVYAVSVSNGGIRLIEDFSVYYEEYPVEDGLKILDGFIFSLLGLYDLFQATQKQIYLGMFHDGIDAIDRNMRFWDYRGKWSRYGGHRFLCTAVYNKLNSALLRVLYGITGRDIFLRYSSAWDPEELTLRARLEVLIAFLMTRNGWRLQNFVSALRG